jgi:Cu/Ag efflux pump CusA
MVVVAAGLMLLFAGLRIRDMPVDVFPELNAPTVVIMTEAPGLAAVVLESYVKFVLYC